MARGIKVPIGAHLLKRKVGTVTGDDGSRFPGRVELYEGFYSQGYKSDFERVRTHYLTIDSDGSRWTFQYSGKNLAEARRQFDDCAGAIEVA